MTMSAGLYTYLVSLTPVTDQVSTRVYNGRAPERTVYPYITYEEISGPTVQQQAAAAGLVDSRFQIDVWAETHPSREATAEAIREALDGFTGSTMGSMTVKRVSLENRQDSVDQADGGSQRAIYRKIIEFRIWYAESVPTFA